MHVNGEGISLLRFFLFPSSCPFLRACACHAGYPKRLTSCYISTFRLGVHELQSLVSIWGLGWFIFFKYTSVALGCGSRKKESYDYGNFCIGIESTTALPWIPKMVNFVISIPALVHMEGLMYAMIVSFPSTFTLLLLPQRLLHFSHYNSVHNVTNAQYTIYCF